MSSGNQRHLGTRIERHPTGLRRRHSERPPKGHPRSIQKDIQEDIQQYVQTFMKNSAFEFVRSGLDEEVASFLSPQTRKNVLQSDPRNRISVKVLKRRIRTNFSTECVDYFR